jgi:hypothetical protein
VRNVGIVSEPKSLRIIESISWGYSNPSSSAISSFFSAS